MPIPTEPVGPLPPPQAACRLANYPTHKISKEELKAEQDAACRDSITRIEATGAPGSGNLNLT